MVVSQSFGERDLHYSMHVSISLKETKSLEKGTWNIASTFPYPSRMFYFVPILGFMAEYMELYATTQCLILCIDSRHVCWNTPPAIVYTQYVDPISSYYFKKELKCLGVLKKCNFRIYSTINLYYYYFSFERWFP